MKKFLLALVLVLPMVLVGCSSEIERRADKHMRATIKEAAYYPESVIIGKIKKVWQAKNDSSIILHFEIEARKKKALNNSNRPEDFSRGRSLFQFFPITDSASSLQAVSTYCAHTMASRFFSVLTLSRSRIAVAMSAARLGGIGFIVPPPVPLFHRGSRIHL